MSNSSNNPKSTNGGKEKMVTTAFRLGANDLTRAKEKAGIVALSKYLRALVLMWLNGDIKVTEEDVKKYND